jgi:hypothetical protein
MGREFVAITVIQSVNGGNIDRGRGEILNEVKVVGEKKVKRQSMGFWTYSLSCRALLISYLWKVPYIFTTRNIAVDGMN